MNRLGVLVFASLLCLTTSAEIPPSWKICSRNDPELSNCVATSFEHALPQLKDGLIEFGIPPLEPANLGNLSAKGNPDSPLNLSQNITNAMVYNATKSKISKSQVLFNRKEFQVKLNFFSNGIWIEGGYQLMGKVYEVPINASGHGRIDLLDVEVIDVITGGFYEKDGKRHIKLDNISVLIEPKKITHKLDDPNADEKTLRETEKLLDEKWDQIWEGVRRHYEARCEIILMKMFQTVFDAFDTDQLFPA